jgi:hypothetical protein
MSAEKAVCPLCGKRVQRVEDEETLLLRVGGNPMRAKRYWHGGPHVLGDTPCLVPDRANQLERER